MPHVTVTYKEANGLTLRCEYDYRVTPGKYCGLPEDCYPDETEAGDPTYFLNGEQIDENDLPTELVSIAEEMYEADEWSTKFTCVVTNP